MSQERYVYGRHPVSECLRAQPKDIARLLVASSAAARLEDLVRGAERAGIAVEILPRQALDKIANGAPHQGIVALVAAFRYASLEALVDAANGKPPLLVALDQVQDPHNLGSLIRSAYALGAHGLLFPKDRACEITPAVTKAAAGATAHLPIARVTNLTRALEQLKKAGLWTVGTAPEAKTTLDRVDLTMPAVIVVGSEASGMRQGVTNACDFLAQIPMVGQLGSLNAAVAGAVVLYEAARQRASAAK